MNLDLAANAILTALTSAKSYAYYHFGQRYYYIPPY